MLEQLLEYFGDWRFSPICEWATMFNLTMSLLCHWWHEKSASEKRRWKMRDFFWFVICALSTICTEFVVAVLWLKFTICFVCHRFRDAGEKENTVYFQRISIWKMFGISTDSFVYTMSSSKTKTHLRSSIESFPFIGLVHSKIRCSMTFSHIKEFRREFFFQFDFQKMSHIHMNERESIAVDGGAVQQQQQQQQV